MPTPLAKSIQGPPLTVISTFVDSSPPRTPGVSLAFGPHSPVSQVPPQHLPSVISSALSPPHPAPHLSDTHTHADIQH